MSVLFDSQNAGEETVEELDKLRHADGNVTVADLRLEMQKVSKIYIFLLLIGMNKWSITRNAERGGG